jgi:hypothetical protein
LALVMTLVAGHGIVPGVKATPSASARRTPQPSALLPAFGDWRAAYLASDGSVHVVSLDGKSDLTGPALRGLTNDNVFSGMSADGHHLAYIDAPKWGDLIVVDLRSPGGSSSTVTYSGQITGASWSPDGTRLVADATLSTGHGLDVFPADGGTPKLVPGTNDTGPLAYSILQGWYDNTHILAMVSIASVRGSQGAVGGPAVAHHSGGPELAALALAPHSSGPKVLATVDVTTGQARELSAVPGQAVVGPTLVVMSPDHTLALAENSCNGVTGCTVQPNLYRVNLASGQSAALPHITAATNGNPAWTTWLPGTHTVLALGPDSRSATSPVLLLDLDHDTVTTLATGIYPIELSPDGKTLVAGDLAAFNSLVNEYPLYAFAPISAAGHKITLTQHMLTYLGLVKTA